MKSTILHFVCCLVLAGMSFFVQPTKAFAVDSKSLTCISFRALNKLALSGNDEQNNGNSELFNLANITNFDGYIVDPANHDLILFGESLPDRPSLHLDDLAVVLQNVWEADRAPYCSLDPNPNDLLQMQRILSRRASPGNEDNWIKEVENDLADVQKNWHAQKVVIKGVPRNSHFARIMVDADYHMKRVTLSLISLPNVTSYLDRFIAYNKQLIPTPTLHNAPFSAARFWFHMHSFDYKDSSLVPYPQFQESEGIVVLENCEVVLLTEKQLTDGKGDMIGVVEQDTMASEFAREFSEQLQPATGLVSSYAKLEQLFRLNALVRAMKLWDVFIKAGISSETFRTGYRPRQEEVMPDTLAGLVNYVKNEKFVDVNGKRYISVQFPVAYGGVDMTFPVTYSQFLHSRRLELDKLKRQIIAARPNLDSAAWKIDTLLLTK